MPEFVREFVFLIAGKAPSDTMEAAMEFQDTLCNKTNVMQAVFIEALKRTFFPAKRRDLAYVEQILTNK